MDQIDIDAQLAEAQRLEEEQRRANERRVILDPSSPSVRSIARVVIVTLILVAIGGYVQSLITSLTYLFFIIILSVFFAYLIEPVVRLIRRPFAQAGAERFMPRALAIAISYVIVFSALGAAAGWIAPRVAEQAREFANNVPSYGTAVQQWANDLSRRFDRLRIPDEVQADIGKKVTDMASYASSEIGAFLLLSVTFVPWLLLIPILSFFFLKDVNIVRLAILRSFPVGKYRLRADSILQDVNATLAAYARAQLLSCVIIGIICTIGFWAIGLRFALLLGILAAIFEFVPLLGPLALAVIATATAAASDSPNNAIYTAFFLILLRIVHDYFTYPRIIRGGIHLHPLAIILSVLAGEQIAGIPGVFLAIPVVAIGTVFYRHALEHRGERSLIAGLFEEDETAATNETAQ